MGEACIMGDARHQTARGLALLPLILMGALHLTVPPLSGTFELEPLLMVLWYAVALVLGLVLFRKTRVVKDHEYNRAKAMRSIRHVYKAEAEGVWERDVSLDGQLTGTSNLALGQTVGSLAPETDEIELDNDSKVEVKVLTGTVGVNSSKTSTEYDDAPVVQRTLGAQAKEGPMDRILDTVFGWFGRDTKAERESQRQARMLGNARAAPVIAQRPIAPLRLNTRDDDGEVQMTSMSDTGGVETVLTSRGSEVSNGMLPEDSGTSLPMTLEQMAQIQSVAPSSSPSQVPACRGCGGTAPAGIAYCPHCGLDL